MEGIPDAHLLSASTTIKISLSKGPPGGEPSSRGSYSARPGRNGLYGKKPVANTSMETGMRMLARMTRTVLAAGLQPMIIHSATPSCVDQSEERGGDIGIKRRRYGIGYPSGSIGQGGGQAIEGSRGTPRLTGQDIKVTATLPSSTFPRRAPSLAAWKYYGRYERATASCHQGRRKAVLRHTRLVADKISKKKVEKSMEKKQRWI